MIDERTDLMSRTCHCFLGQTHQLKSETAKTSLFIYKHKDINLTVPSSLSLLDGLAATSGIQVRRVRPQHLLRRLTASSHHPLVFLPSITLHPSVRRSRDTVALQDHKRLTGFTLKRLNCTFTMTIHSGKVADLGVGTTLRQFKNL